MNRNYEVVARQIVSGRPEKIVRVIVTAPNWRQARRRAIEKFRYYDGIFKNVVAFAVIHDAA